MKSIVLFGIPAPPELIIIFVIFILIFGANKIPKIARSAGMSIGEFQKGKEKAEKDLDKMREELSEEEEEEEEEENEY